MLPDISSALLGGCIAVHLISWRLFLTLRKSKVNAQSCAIYNVFVVCLYGF